MTKMTLVVDQWTDRRNDARSIGKRLTYDCLQAKVDGARVRCALARRLSASSSDGSASLDSVLQGIAYSTCKRCPDYISEQDCSEY